MAGYAPLSWGNVNTMPESFTVADKTGNRTLYTAGSALAAGLTADLLGKDPATAALAARNAAENNYLTARQIAEIEKAKSECNGDALCVKRVEEAALALSSGQDIGLSLAKLSCIAGYCNKYDQIMGALANEGDPLLVVRHVAALHPDWTLDQIKDQASAYLTEANDSVNQSAWRTFIGTLDATAVFGASAIARGPAKPVVLELFGGKTAQVPGAINVDLIAGSGGIRTSVSNLPVKSGSVDQIVVSNPYIQKAPGETKSIMDWFSEAARVLKPGGEIIVNGTKNNPYTRLPNADELEKLGFRVVQKEVPLLPQFQNQIFHFTDGRIIPNESIRSTILEKVH
jgi:filamentous hemagglutinin